MGECSGQHLGNTVEVACSFSEEGTESEGALGVESCSSLLSYEIVSYAEKYMAELLAYLSRV